MNQGTVLAGLAELSIREYSNLDATLNWITNGHKRGLRLSSAMPMLERRSKSLQVVETVETSFSSSALLETKSSNLYWLHRAG